MTQLNLVDECATNCCALCIDVVFVSTVSCTAATLDNVEDANRCVGRCEARFQSSDKRSFSLHPAPEKPSANLSRVCEHSTLISSSFTLHAHQHTHFCNRASTNPPALTRRRLTPPGCAAAQNCGDTAVGTAQYVLSTRSLTQPYTGRRK